MAGSGSAAFAAGDGGGGTGHGGSGTGRAADVVVGGGVAGTAGCCRDGGEDSGGALALARSTKAASWLLLSGMRCPSRRTPWPLCRQAVHSGSSSIRQDALVCWQTALDCHTRCGEQ